MDNLVCVGKIGRPDGLRGYNRLNTYTSGYDFFYNHRDLLVGFPDDGHVNYSETVALLSLVEFKKNIYYFKTSDIREKNQSLLVRMDGIHNRSDAAKIVNCHLYILRSQMKDPGPGEYYHSDLNGCSVFNMHGRKVGVVLCVHNFGAGDFLEIRLDREFCNKNNALGTIGFNANSIIDVNINDKKIIINETFLL